jgi:glycosyltransferase involved in cell wall biosynthesis
MKVLLSAYACRPHEGSEPAVGWNWARELARLGYDVHVLTRLDNKAAIEAETAQHPSPITFLYYDLPRPLSEERIGVYLSYSLWQYGAYRFIRKTYGRDYFDVLHHLTYVSFRFPVFWYRLKGRFILGPVAGGEEGSPNLIAGLPRPYRLIERFRRVVNRMNVVNVFINTAYRKAERIFAATDETFQKIPARYRRKTAIAPAVGIEASSAPSSPKHETFTVLYAGQLLHWKGVHLAIESFAKAVAMRPGLQFTIIGSGPFERALRRQVEALGLEAHVRFIRNIPQAELFEHYRTAHLFLFPSLHDSGGFVVLEAMAAGLPVICLDRGGPPVLVGKDSRNVVGVAGKSVAQITDDIARLIHLYAEDPARLEEESARARQRAADFEWTKVVRNVYPAAA